MLDLELLIRLRGHFNLVTDPVIDLGLALNSTSNDFISEQSLLDDAIVWSRGAEILVVNF